MCLETIQTTKAKLTEQLIPPTSRNGSHSILSPDWRHVEALHSSTLKTGTESLPEALEEFRVTQLVPWEDAHMCVCLCVCWIVGRISHFDAAGCPRRCIYICLRVCILKRRKNFTLWHSWLPEKMPIYVCVCVKVKQTLECTVMHWGYTSTFRSFAMIFHLDLCYSVRLSNNFCKLAKWMTVFCLPLLPELLRLLGRGYSLLLWCTGSQVPLPVSMFI
jgi:hypothetical protein